MTKDQVILKTVDREIRIVLGESEFDRKQREELERLEREKREKERQEVIAREIKRKTHYKSSTYSNYEIVGTSYSQCVIYAQSKGLKLQGYGYARNYPTNSDTPNVGGFIKTNESSAGHLAYIVGIDGDNITIEESNYRRGYITRRTLNIADPIIKGYINE